MHLGSLASGRSEGRFSSRITAIGIIADHDNHAAVRLTPAQSEHYRDTILECGETLLYSVRGEGWFG